MPRSNYVSLRPQFSTAGRTAAAAAAATALAVILPVACTSQNVEEQDFEVPEITISPDIPSELNPNGGGPEMATLQQAAVFAWEEFIALNWPADLGTDSNPMRDVPDTSKKLGDPGTLVWETYRGKVEIYPGTAIGSQQGYQYPFPDYNAPPEYIYQPSEVGTSDGMVPACPGQTTGATPWVNLDETTQIGLDEMFAGISTESPFPGQQILFLAKANKAQFDYVTKTNRWFGNTSEIDNYPVSAFAAPVSDTATYVAANKKSPPAGSTSLVSFPNGTIELKSAWRRLNPSEEDGSRYHTAPVRFYMTNPGTEKPCYKDETWAMQALHIIHKTPGAPYFIFATFEQADNILTTDGQPVENPDGSFTAAGGMVSDPLSPNIVSHNSEPAGDGSITTQTFSNTTPPTTPEKQLYYLNEPGLGLPETKWIGVNKRKHDIPDTVIAVNEAAQEAIAGYNDGKSTAQYYKLVNVQYVPVDKPAGVTYSGTPPLKTPAGEDVATGTYYQANIVVETDYNLQVFSGRFNGSSGTITDYNDNATPFYNVLYGGHQANMGGCMGCHGNAQVKGSDFSFILGNPPQEPEVAADNENMGALVEKYQLIRRVGQ